MMSHEFGSSQEEFCRRNPVMKISNKIRYGQQPVDEFQRLNRVCMVSIFISRFIAV
jgi:hypothetical protein